MNRLCKLPVAGLPVRWQNLAQRLAQNRPWRQQISLFPKPQPHPIAKSAAIQDRHERFTPRFSPQSGNQRNPSDNLVAKLIICHDFPFHRWTTGIKHVQGENLGLVLASLTILTVQPAHATDVTMVQCRQFPVFLFMSTA